MKTTTKQVLLTVASLIATAAFGFLAFAEPVPVAQAQVARHLVPVTVLRADPVEPAAQNVIEVPEVHVVGERPQPKSKSWQCGEFRPLVQGPIAQRVRPCEWK